MSSKKTIKKYDDALAIILFCVSCNPKTNLTEVRKYLKINKNFISSLFKLGIIKNNGRSRASKYVVVKEYTPKMTLEVLKFSNELSTNKRPVVIVEEQKQQPVKELNFFQKIIKTLFNGTI